MSKCGCWNKYPEGSLSLPEVLNQVRLVSCVLCSVGVLNLVGKPGQQKYVVSSKSHLCSQKLVQPCHAKAAEWSLAYTPQTAQQGCLVISLICVDYFNDSLVVPRSNPPGLGKPSEPFTLAAERIWFVFCNIFEAANVNPRWGGTARLHEYSWTAWDSAVEGDDPAFLEEFFTGWQDYSGNSRQPFIIFVLAILATCIFEFTKRPTSSQTF